MQRRHQQNPVRARSGPVGAMWGLLAVGVVAACSGPEKRKEATPPPPKVTKKLVFKGNTGLLVEVLDLEGDRALLRVSGVSNPLAGKVLEHGRELRGRRQEPTYVTRWHGRQRITLQRYSRYGRASWRVYLPGSLRPRVVRYDAQAAAALDVAAIWKVHFDQHAAGELGRLQRFDRAAEQAAHDRTLAAAAGRMNKVCRAKVAVAIAWPSVSDKTMRSYSVASYCASVVDALREFCGDSAATRRFVAQRIKRVRCHWRASVGDRKAQLKVSRGTLHWRVTGQDSGLTRQARAAVGRLEVKPGLTIARAKVIARSDVCRDASGKHVVIVAPEGPRVGVSYGDGKTFWHTPAPYGLSRGWFFDPRQYNARNNARFRGHDLRVYSRVEVDRKQRRCTVVCGTRKTQLKLVDEATKQQTISGARYKPRPFQREPYALARNRRGVYYFVDRGTTAATKRDFRVYIGQRGRLRRQKMKDVVSDSEGTIFSTTRGDLRLVLGKGKALWIKRKKPKPLLWVPVRDNYPLIFNELGVYLGQKLGVPCDDF